MSYKTNDYKASALFELVKQVYGFDHISTLTCILSMKHRFRCIHVALICYTHSETGGVLCTESAPP